MFVPEELLEIAKALITPDPDGEDVEDVEDGEDACDDE